MTKSDSRSTSSSSACRAPNSVSICGKTGYLHLVVPKSRFRLLRGQAELTTYTFNTGVAKHLFCSVCGIKSFYVPRSHPDGFSVNARCIDAGTIEEMTVTPFDGRNWEAQYPKGRGEYHERGQA